jgi:hypothetical protein
MNTYRITYAGTEFEETAENIQEAIHQFVYSSNTHRRIELITRVELI